MHFWEHLYQGITGILTDAKERLYYSGVCLKMISRGYMERNMICMAGSLCQKKHDT